MILWFDEVGATAVSNVGGKGANLSEAVRAGFPVPPGFCVTVEAYRAATSHLTEELTELADSGDASRARELVREASIPDEVDELVRHAYQRLGAPPVAVRSSATAEDLREASFAGQQDTYLGVRGEDDLLDALRRCWASLWTDRAVAYRRKHGFRSADVALSVVVQKLVAPEVSGVLFTKDPVSHESGSMVASASYGLGESVVAGLVTPDNFSLGRAPAAVREVTIGTKETRIDAVDTGGVRTSTVPEQDRARACLSEARMLDLVSLGEKVEEYYGAPQDIEWAIAEDSLWLLQSRPITTSQPMPTRAHGPVRGRIPTALRDDLIEHYPAPYPLDVMAVRRVQEQIQGLMREIGLGVPPAERVIRVDDDGVVGIHAEMPRVKPRVMVAIPRLMRKGLRHDPREWAQRAAEAEQELAKLRDRADGVTEADDRDVLTLIEDAVAAAAEMTHHRFLHYLSPMVLRRAEADAMVRIAGLSKDIATEDLYAGVDYTTAVIDRALARLSSRLTELDLESTLLEADSGTIRERLLASEPGRELLREVDDFLAEHGARTTRMYLPFSNRSWREDPESLLVLLTAAVRGHSDGPATGSRGESRDAVAEVRGRLPRFLRQRWTTTADRLRALHVGREASLYMIEEFFCVARRGMDEVAARLRRAGVLANAEDIRFLTYEEVCGALPSEEPPNLAELVERRSLTRSAAEALWWDRGGETPTEGALRGLAASQGRAAGPARLVSGPAEFDRVQAGDVLVCRYTDPTWTPLFSLASAVVADSGGPLSHAAIVARECGIPAVLGTQVATQRYRDGDPLVVDGTRGTVSVEGA